MKPKPKAVPPMSLSAYAKRRGVSVEAVSKAIKAGRLVASVARVNGQPKIGDSDLADTEWAMNTRAPTVLTASETEDLEEAKRLLVISRAKREEAAARREGSLAELAELDVRQRRGELILASDVAEKFIEVVTVAKGKLLGLPARVKQRLPHVTAEDVRVIDALLREALEDLADER